MSPILTYKEKETYKNIENNWKKNRDDFPTEILHRKRLLAKTRLKADGSLSDIPGSISKTKKRIESIQKHLSFLESKILFLNAKGNEKSVKELSQDYFQLQTAGKMLIEHLKELNVEKADKKSVKNIKFGIEKKNLSDDIEGILEKFKPKTEEANQVKETLQKKKELANDIDNSAIKESALAIANMVSLKGKEYPHESIPVNQKLLNISKKVLGVLDKIHEDMIDEQKTEIKKISKSPKKKEVQTPVAAMVKEKESDKGRQSSSGDMMAAVLGGIGLASIAGIGGIKALKGIGSLMKGSKNLLKGAGKGILKGLARSTKFLGPLGIAITAGMSIYDAVAGWEKAGENLGIDEKELTTLNKVSSAAGSTISGLTFGLADESETAKGINNLLGGNEIIEKYENLGIIDHDTIGNSDILDWNKFRNLSANDIKQILAIDDWSDEDLKKMIAILEKKQEESSKRIQELSQEKIKSTPKPGIGFSESVPDYTKIEKPGISGDDDLKRRIKMFEGLRLDAYQDSLGYWTVGYGHLIGPHEQHLMNGITKEEADALFEEDYMHHKKSAEKFPTFNEHPKEVQDVLVDMTYNMGDGWWKSWDETPKAIQNKEYRVAGEYLSTSLYAKQTKRRAEFNINELYKASERTPEKSQEPVFESNKEIKESLAYNDNQELVQRTKNYDRSSSSSGTSEVQQTSINNQNVIQKEEKNPGLLNMFA